MDAAPLKPERLKAFVLNGGGHAFDTRTGRSYSVNDTAQVALLMLQDGATRGEVIDRLVELCGQPSAVVTTGVDAFIEQVMRCVA